MFITRVQNVWFTLAIDDSDRILRLRRSPKKVTSGEELDAVFEQLHVAIEGIIPSDDRAKWSLLQDMRAAPLLDNPDWRAKQLRLVERFQHGWRRMAVLVQTPIGRLQARRLGQALNPTSVVESGSAIFQDEIAALNFVRQAT